jgi:hypothetical protein
MAADRVRHKTRRKAKLKTTESYKVIVKQSPSANNNGQVKPSRRVTAAEFLRRRYGEAPGDLHILIWCKKGETKESHWLRVDQLDEAESFLAPFCKADAGDVYAGVSLSPTDFGRNKRCDADKAAGIAGLWADIDVKGAAHKKDNLPGTTEQARELARSLGVEPTEEIFSGHGLQVWWLFREPWIFADSSERQQAADLALRFQKMLRTKAQESGWDIDSTHDLARILRLPGTFNHKVGDPVRVRILQADGPRYEVGDFLALLPPEESSPDQGTSSGEDSSAADMTTVERARRYISRMPAAVSGQNGHQAAWAAAQVLLRGFALSPDEARPLMQEYNTRCLPPWSETELEHKIQDAATKSRLPQGYLLNNDSRKSEVGTDGKPEAQDGQRAGPYLDNGCIHHLKILKDGVVPVPLCNFSARIVEDVLHDDGAEQMRRLILEGKLADGPRLPRAEVSATEFAGMGWVVPAWGTRAVVNAGMSVKDHLRAALQLLSGDVPRRVIYAHTGWREIEAGWHYLHSGGAIGADGLAAGVEVSLPGPLAGFELPVPPEGEQLVTAVRASLRMLDGLAPDQIVFPVHAAVYRAVLGDVDFSLVRFFFLDLWESAIMRMRSVPLGLVMVLACGLGMLSAVGGQEATPTAASADEPPPLPKGIEVMARGPVHEAFASLTSEAAPTTPVAKRPPKPLDEMPPADKPEGQVVWIGGYWAWDEDRKDFLWVSGIWRTPPPHKQWIAGYWREEGEAWQWVPGFWTDNSAEQDAKEVA